MTGNDLALKELTHDLESIHADYLAKIEALRREQDGVIRELLHGVEAREVAQMKQRVEKSKYAS